MAWHEEWKDERKGVESASCALTDGRRRRGIAAPGPVAESAAAAAGHDKAPQPRPAVRPPTADSLGVSLKSIRRQLKVAAARSRRDRHALRLLRGRARQAPGHRVLQGLRPLHARRRPLGHVTHQEILNAISPYGSTWRALGAASTCCRGRKKIGSRPATSSRPPHGVNHVGDGLGGVHQPRSRHHELVAHQQRHPPVADRRHAGSVFHAARSRSICSGRASARSAGR